MILAGLGWAVTNTVSWITVTSPGGSVTGDGTVSYSVSSNTGAGSRIGMMAIADTIFTVTQEGTCSYSITPVSQSFGVSDGMGSVNVSDPCGLGWTATSNDPSWITVTSPGGSVTGDGTVSYSIDPNTDSSRTGSMTIADKAFTVTQDGETIVPTSCPEPISPAIRPFGSGGGTDDVYVVAPDGCNWTVSSSDPSWLNITSGNDGTGDGIINYSVLSNTGSSRTGYYYDCG